MSGECSVVGEQKCWDVELITYEVINSAILYSQAAIGYSVAIVFVQDVERFSISGVGTFDIPYPYNVYTSFVLGITGGATVGGAMGVSKGLMKITGCALGITGFERDDEPMLNHEKDNLLPQLSHVDLLSFWAKHMALHFGALGYGAFGCC